LFSVGRIVIIIIIIIIIIVGKKQTRSGTPKTRRSKNVYVVSFGVGEPLARPTERV
jgi:hypothetical protein